MRATTALLLVLAAAPAHAAAAHDWYVLKTEDGAYAYDLGDVENAHGISVKSVAVYVGAGADEVLYDIDCATGRGLFVGSISDTALVMTEGNPAPSSRWSAIPGTGSMKIAADVACLRHATGSIRADSGKDALDKLKHLSN